MGGHTTPLEYAEREPRLYKWTGHATEGHAGVEWCAMKWYTQIENIVSHKANTHYLENK